TAGSASEVEQGCEPVAIAALGEKPLESATEAAPTCSIGSGPDRRRHALWECQLPVASGAWPCGSGDPSRSDRSLGVSSRPHSVPGMLVARSAMLHPSGL